MKFIIMVWPAFLARVKPVSASAKPACMNMTRKPATSTHTKLIDTRLWPTKSATSSSVGLPAVLAVTSATPPVAVPAGSGLEGGGAGAATAGAGAAGAGGAAALSWARTQPPTASNPPTARAMAHARSARCDDVVSMPLMLGPFLESRCLRAASAEKATTLSLAGRRSKRCAAPTHDAASNHGAELRRVAHEWGCCGDGQRLDRASF